MAVDAAVLRARVEVAGVQQATSDLRGFGAQINTVGQQSGTAAQSVTRAGQSLTTMGGIAATARGQVDGFKAGIQSLAPVALGTTGAVVGLGLAAKSSVDSAIAWESSLAGVAKTLDTTGLSAEQAEQAVADIGSEIRAMALEIPIAATELAGVAEAAGQLGVAREDVVTFTETMAKLGVATDLTAEQSATAIARIANITGLATEDVDNFGAALVDLGNNSAATESEILNMATRIAGAGDMAGLTEGEILGLAAALTSVGINAEAGGTAIVQVMNEITTSVETADSRLATFAAIAGQSASQFAEMWRANPNEALVQFIEGLGQVEAQGESTVLVLDELGLDGIRVSQALNSAANAGDLLRDSMDRGNTAMEENIALNEEAARRFETTASEIQIFKNNLEELQITLGALAIPELTQSMDDLLPILQGITSLVQTGGASDEQWREFLGGPDFFNDAGVAALNFFGVVSSNETTLHEAFGDVPTMLEAIEAKLTGPTLDAVREFFGLPAQHGPGTISVFRDINTEIERLLGFTPELAAEQGAFTDELDRFRNIGQQATLEMREATVVSEGWRTALQSIFQSVQEQPESITGFIDEIVNGFRTGQVEIDQIGRLLKHIPEDVFHDSFIPALQDLRVEWLTTIAEMGDPAEIAVAQENMAALDQIMQDLGITIDNVKTGIGTFGEVQDLFQLNIDNAAAGVSEWEGHLSGAERALGFLQDKIDAGIPLTVEQLQQYDDLTWATERYAGGVDDEAQALIDAEVAKAEFVRVQDELNAALADGRITQDEYNDAITTAAAELDPATAASMGLVDAQSKLAEGLDGTIKKIVDLLVELGILDETEAEAIVGADTEPAETNVDRMEGRLQTYEGSTYTTSVDADTSAAQTALDNLIAQIASGAILPVSLSVGPAGGGVGPAGGPFASGTGPGGVPHDMFALVGEEGPELAFLPQGTHILPNDETQKFLALLGGMNGLPGFAEGTPGATMGAGAQATGIDVKGFVDVGDAIAQAIALGVKLGLIESGVPTGEEYAAAILEGAVTTIEVQGPEGMEQAFVVAHERIPDLVADIGDDIIVGLLQQYEDIRGELALAILSGEDTSELQTQLDALFALFAAWSGNTVEEVEEVWAEIADAAKAEEAKAMWEDVLGSISTPQAPVSINMEDIISGDALEDVHAAFQELWDLQKMYEEAGMPEQAAAIGEQLKALGLQEELIESLAGTDTAQKLADELALEEFAAELEGRMDAVLGDDPMGLADSLQAEIDALQQKIDLGPALGATTEQIEAWQEELAGLVGNQDQFWADMATAFEAGMLDPEALAGLDDAGRMMLEDMLMQMFGQTAVEALHTALDSSAADREAALAEILSVPIDALADGSFLEEQQKKLDALYEKLELAEALGLDPTAILAEIEEQEALLAAAGEAMATPIVEEFAAGMGKLGEEGLAQLREIFTEYPEMAVDMVDDLIEAVEDGTLPFEDAMALLGNVPEKDLIPALEALEEQLTVDLAQALLEFGPDSPEVQAILASLGLIDAALDDVTDSVGEANAALDNLPGSKNYVAPGDQSPDGTGGPSQDTAGVLSGSNIPAELALLAMDATGFARKLFATPANIAGIDPSDWLANVDGLASVKAYPGLSQWGGAEVQEVNELIRALQGPGMLGFDQGGFITGGGLAMLHPNEYITPDKSIPQLADEIVKALMRVQGNTSGGPHIYIDGREVTHATLSHLNAYVPATMSGVPS